MLVGAVVWLFLMVGAWAAGIQVAPTHHTGLDLLAFKLQAWRPVLLPVCALGILLAAIYSAVFSIIWQGQTPGQRVAGLRLVDDSGEPPSPTRAVIRAGLAILSFSVFLIGFWWALFDARGQTLHDKLTSTFVVRPG